MSFSLLFSLSLSRSFSLSRSTVAALCVGLPVMVAEVACTGGPANTYSVAGDGANSAGSSDEGTTSGGSRSGGGSMNPSAGGGPGDRAQSEPIDITGVTKIVVARTFCGGAPNTCYGQFTYTIDFASATLDVTSCPRDGDSDGGIVTEPSESLTPAQLQSVREALGQLRRRSDDGSIAYDGQMDALSVTTPSGTTKFSPEPTCNHGAYTLLVSDGWSSFISTVAGL